MHLVEGDMLKCAVQFISLKQETGFCAGRKVWIQVNSALPFTILPMRLFESVSSLLNKNNQKFFTELLQIESCNYS